MMLRATRVLHWEQDRRENIDKVKELLTAALIKNDDDIDTLAAQIIDMLHPPRWRKKP